MADQPEQKGQISIPKCPINNPKCQISIPKFPTKLPKFRTKFPKFLIKLPKSGDLWALTRARGDLHTGVLRKKMLKSVMF